MSSSVCGSALPNGRSHLLQEPDDHFLWSLSLPLLELLLLVFTPDFRDRFFLVPCFCFPLAPPECLGRFLDSFLGGEGVREECPELMDIAGGVTLPALRVLDEG